MDVITATAAYEKWLRTKTAVVEADLRQKHTAMAADLFAFFRATFYRWAALWPELCPELDRAPVLRAVGDLHVQNFGTWRDHEGRLVWGLNDVDEASMMPYTIDLVRLATSALLARREGHLRLKPRQTCAAVLDGYAAALKAGGAPFVLEEEHPGLRAWAMSAERDPERFWAKVEAFKDVRPPAHVHALLQAALPYRRLKTRVVHRISGLGSLGRPRYAALAVWRGAKVAREAKACLPSAYDWALGRTTSRFHAAAILDNAVRCPDPYFRFSDGWLIRRIGPHCSRIDVSWLPRERDEARLLHAMGHETANVHLGTKNMRGAILRHLAKQPEDWLLTAARAMAKATKAEWKAWRAKHASKT
jgi:hypothetical protein